MRRHEGNKPYRCSACDKTFCTIFELDQHTPTHTGERPYSCRYCPAEFATRSALHNHAPTHLPLHRRVFRCPLCPAEFAHRATLKAHERTHSDECPHRCHVCSRVFSQKSNLLRHLQCHEREEAKGEPLPCPNCSKVFDSKGLLKAHRRMCGHFHKCSDCGKGFVLEADLKDHMARKHGPSSESSDSSESSEEEQEEEEKGTPSHARGYEGSETSCDEAEQDVSDQGTSDTQPAAVKRSYWSVRMKPHGKENNPRALKRSHATSHRRDKRSEVPADEGGSNNQSSSTAAPTSQASEKSPEHVEGTAPPRMSTNDTAAASIMKRSCPRYDCPKCENFFGEWDALKSHMALNHKETLLSSKYVFQCHLCDKTFSQNSNLKTHLKSHDRVVSFICDVCGEGFALKHHLKRHKDKKHSVES